MTIPSVANPTPAGVALNALATLPEGKLLQLGDRDPGAPYSAHGPVAALQAMLIATGDYHGAVDGILWRLTQAAVVAFQARVGLKGDGIAGPRTRAALLSAASGETPEAVAPTPSPLGALPVSARARALILDFEVGGGKPYYDLKLSRPTWPGLRSGVTVGVGFDLGQTGSSEIRRVWTPTMGADAASRFAMCAGVTGRDAKRLIDSTPALAATRVPWAAAILIFENSTLVKWTKATVSVFPGVERLPADAFGALVSLVFNRGPALAGNSRLEMRVIRNLIAGFAEGIVDGAEACGSIANQIEAMIPLWEGTEDYEGLSRRRRAEAAMVRSAAP